MPNQIDVYVGGKLRGLRSTNKLTQRDLAKKINVSAQQLQKYESAANRISASTLYEIAQILDVNPGFFFEGFKDENLDDEAMINDIKANQIGSMYKRIDNAQTKDKIYDLIKVLAAEQ